MAADAALHEAEQRLGLDDEAQYPPLPLHGRPAAQQQGRGRQQGSSQQQGQGHGQLGQGRALPNGARTCQELEQELLFPPQLPAGPPLAQSQLLPRSQPPPPPGPSPAKRAQLPTQQLQAQAQAPMAQQAQAQAQAQTQAQAPPPKQEPPPSNWQPTYGGRPQGDSLQLAVRRELRDAATEVRAARSGAGVVVAAGVLALMRGLWGVR
jgi:hypothetical protein